MPHTVVTDLAAIPPLSREYCPKSSISVGIGTMIGPKTPTIQAVNGSGGCAGSSHQNKRNDFFPFTAWSALIFGRDVTASLLPDIRGPSATLPAVEHDRTGPCARDLITTAHPVQNKLG
ncbi:MAG TPA: hypothetical protein VLJ11_07150 [Bryobacteraceae bacterium]|nr:hypothetical protein [Bryobacteraceae bacterium]